MDGEPLMCGIAGILNFRSGRPVDPALLESMRDTMVHRGPDDGGTFTDGEVGLGHRRLSILDLSPAGHQPMTSPDGRYVIAFNGEIYNYLELKAQHFGGEAAFASSSDTAVLLALYRKLGPACVEHLNGMFAFAVWDKRERCLFLARDRLGKKPLYYAHTPDGLAFASEMKALIALPGVDKTLFEENILAYMAFGYVAGEKTLLKGIRKLPAGHRMTVKDGKIEASAYWTLRYRPGPDRGEKTTVEEFGALLEDAIKLRLRSDVPLGIFLSGGLDSSAVVALLARNGAKALKTFSVAFDFGGRFDETGYARKVADTYQTDHHQTYLSPADFRDYIPGYIWHMDEPVCQASAIPLWHIAKVAKEHVTVVLSGEGADEVLAGYPIYRTMLMLERLRGAAAGA
ncbi:MAG TPA: asparagine synthase (glutamine-hydrolyzing), partial [Fibrobacteria bacterium]|nr:asparagine synthase (glutamine-hydrolyzing) [Fibrobacteria bacterium]